MDSAHCLYRRSRIAINRYRIVYRDLGSKQPIRRGRYRLGYFDSAGSYGIEPDVRVVHVHRDGQDDGDRIFPER